MTIRSLYLTLFMLIAGVSAEAEILIVGPDQAYKTISAAVDAAQSGDTIRVQAGTYKENLVLDRTLRLEGIDNPVIQGTGAGSVLTVTARDCVISGFRIERSGGDLQAEDAGILLKSSGNTVEGNELHDVLFGVYLLHSSGNSILKNRIVGRAELESGERGAGLHLWNSPDNTLEDNIISYARDGMYIQSSSNNTIRRNRVSNLRYGLHYMNSDNNRFEDNLFVDNVAGAAIMYSQNIELRRNGFVRNRGFSSFGILFQDCRQCVTEDNLILNNGVGIFLEGTKNSEFRRNTIAENDVALQIFSSADGSSFTQNNFVNNLSPLQLIGKSSRTQWQVHGAGNYWSDYAGYDLDGDGVGDVPHKIQNIFEYLEGNLPRLRVYLNSPAAQSIAAAERSFPILTGSKEFDSKPLMRPVGVDFSLRLESEYTRLDWLLPLFSLLMLGVAGLIFTGGRAR